MSNERPIAIQFSDLRGFSSFTAQHGDQKAFQIANQFVDLVGASVSQYGGRLLKTYGDGVMTSFDDPCQAVECAATMQETLCEEYCGQDQDEDPMISAGIGLSWGTAIRTDDDLFGHSVNLAKRLADEAKGGQIVTSSTVVGETGELKKLCYRDMGERELKGVGEQHLYEVVWRPEVARIETPGDQMDIILTDDQKVVVEFGKAAKEQIREVIAKLEDEAESGDEHGLARILKRAITKRIAKSLPNWVEWTQKRAGMGIEHAIHDVEAAIEDGRLFLLLGPKKKRLTFNPHDIDLAMAKAFIERLDRMKAMSPQEDRS